MKVKELRIRIQTANSRAQALKLLFLEVEDLFPKGQSNTDQNKSIGSFRGGMITRIFSSFENFFYHATLPPSILYLYLFPSNQAQTVATVPTGLLHARNYAIC